MLPKRPPLAGAAVDAGVEPAGAVPADCVLVAKLNAELRPEPAPNVEEVLPAVAPKRDCCWPPELAGVAALENRLEEDVDVLLPKILLVLPAVALPAPPNSPPPAVVLFGPPKLN